MSKPILPSTLDYLNSSSVTLAHLVQIEVPSPVGGQNILRVTDYSRDITYQGNIYKAGILKSFGDVKQTRKFTSHTTSISLSGVDPLLITSVMQDYSYIGNSISIHRTHIDSNGDLIPYHSDGTARHLLQGTITEVAAKDLVSASSKGSSLITFKCANEFYDFEKVGGRFTSDEAHRALEVNSQGQAVPSTAVKREEYKTDRGFKHSNKTINLLAKYQTKETRYRLKKKKRLGVTVGYKMKAYQVEVTKNLDLRYNLEGKYIPIVYGVRKVEGIPIFADTNKNNPNRVTVVYAICEGEIETFLDIWFDDNSTVCLNAEDSKDRGCIGSKDGSGYEGFVGFFRTLHIAGMTGGTVHGQSFNINDGNGNITITAYHGKPNQTADPNLVSKALNNNFLLQSRQGQGPEYWDSSCKLLDTAYIVAEYTLSASRTEVPSLSVEVKGRKVFNGTNYSRTSLNPAWQIYDYLTNTRFGMSVAPTDIDYPSFISAASLFDRQDTTYQTSWLPYYMYLGWNNTDDNNRSVMQTNVNLETEAPLFKNMESILDQCMASLNIVDGQYKLTVEALADPIAHISIDDIIGGSVDASDVTIKNKYNSIISTISDPAKSWNDSNVIFYNSAFKEEDNGLEKTLNITFPYITNYYTARSLAERELKKSRYNREVNITLPISYATLPVNAPVTITYERYGWFTKQFLIKDVSLKQNGKTTVGLREYADDVFINSTKADTSDPNEVPPVTNLLRLPTLLEYALPAPDSPVEGINGVLSWIPSTSTDVSTYTVRIVGRQEVYELPHNNLGARISVNIINLPVGTYTFQVRAHSAATGMTSSPAEIEQFVSPKINLPKVDNFILANGDAEGVWADTGPVFTWRGSNEFTSYNLEILNPNGIVVEAVSINQGTAYTWDLQANIAAYTATENAAGYYRDINARIKGVSSSGNTSYQWRYVND